MEAEKEEGEGMKTCKDIYDWTSVVALLSYSHVAMHVIGGNRHA